MRLKPVGDTDLRVSELGLGTAQLGDLFRQSSVELAREIVDAAWAGGIRYFDTAPWYGLGTSERRLGAALAGHERSEFVLSTKVGRIVTDANDAGFRWDYSADGVVESLHQSLERLDTTHIDIALIHDPQGRVDWAITEALPALERLREDGAVRAIGVGSGDLDALIRFAETGRIDVLMVAGRYSLLEQPAAERLLPLCDANGISVLNAGVFNSGLLAEDEPRPDSHYEYAAVPQAVLAQARVLADAARRHSISLPQAALAFAAAPSSVASVVVGAESADQVTRNIHLFEMRAAAAPLLDELEGTP